MVIYFPGLESLTGKDWKMWPTLRRGSGGLVIINNTCLILLLTQLNYYTSKV